MLKNNLPLNYNFILSARTYCYQKRFKEGKQTDAYLPCKDTEVPTDFSSRAMSACTSTQVKYCMHIYLFVTPIDQVQKQLGKRSYSKWYYTRSDVIAKQGKVGFELASKMKCIAGLESVMCLRKVVFCFAKTRCVHIFFFCIILWSILRTPVL